MNEQSSFSIRKRGILSIIDLEGRIIGSRARIIKDELHNLIESGISNLILNMEGVTSIDSLGVMAITAAINDSLSLKIVNISTHCREILEQYHSGRLIPIFGTEDDAVGNSIENDLSINKDKEKRKHERFVTNIPIEIIINNNEQRGILLNISEEGALLGYLDPFDAEPDTIKYINIMMKLPFAGSLELEGTPVRFGKNSHMHTIGIQISSTEKSRRLMEQVHKKPTIQTNESSSFNQI